MVSKEDILATITCYSVLAALIVTVTYTSVITPPREFSPCTDLCQPTTARLVLGVRAAFGACTPQAEKERSASVCLPLESPLYESNNLKWGSTYRPFVLNYLNQVNLSASEAPDVIPYQPLFEAYVVFNAIALLASLCCMAIGALFTYSALDKCDGNNVAHLDAVRFWMKVTLVLSITSVLVAFACVHYYVFWIEGQNNVGVKVVWAMTCLLFLCFIIATCWIYRRVFMNVFTFKTLGYAPSKNSQGADLS